MQRESTFYARPESAPRALALSPRLASWNAVGHPDQVRLTAALDHAEAVLAPALDTETGPFAVRLDIGLPPSVSLLGEHDLDNYLFPLATRLGKRPGLSVVSVWATKQHAAQSCIRVAPAAVVQAPSDGFRRQVHTTASASTTSYKQEIANQLGDAAPLPPGPVALQLPFAVGTRRNWLNLWKPSIDALDQLLGRTVATRSWHPQDGRITELALHRTIDGSLGNDVIIDIAARRLEGLIGCQRVTAT